jgi:hypothetical protein
MKKLLIALIMFMVGSGLAYGALTDDVTASVTGSEQVAITIATASVSFADDGSAGGGSTAAMTGSPITGTCVDSDVTSVASDDFLTVEITTALPTYYGNANSYYLELGDGATNTITETGNSTLANGITVTGDIEIVTAAKTVGEYTGIETNEVMEATLSFPIGVHKVSGKYIPGSASDSHTVRFTLIDVG